MASSPADSAQARLTFKAHLVLYKHVREDLSSASFSYLLCFVDVALLARLSPSSLVLSAFQSTVNRLGCTMRDNNKQK